MATTANRQYPFPTLDDAPNGASQMQALAEAVDRDIQSTIVSTGTVVWSSTGVIGLTLTGATSGSGLSTISAVQLGIDQLGTDIYVGFTVVIGAAISVGGTGNVGNTPLARLPSTHRPSHKQHVASGDTGVLARFSVDVDGTVYLVSTVPNVFSTPTSLLPSGSALSVSGQIKK